MAEPQAAVDGRPKQTGSAQEDSAQGDPLAMFHPAVRRWFRSAFDRPTGAQVDAWRAIRAGEHTLVAAPTGSGKTLAAFLCALDELVREGSESDGGLPDETRVLYISPLKALSNDIERNLEAPLAGIAKELAAMGRPPVAIRRAVRTGDTPQSARGKMLKEPPHLLVTTPESCYLLLTSLGGRGLLKTVRTVIVDEIHAMAGDKRGSHLALSLERLRDLVEKEAVEKEGGTLRRIGLSATQKPIAEVARFLTGGGENGRHPHCRIVDTGHSRPLDLAIEVPDSPLEAVLSNEVWEEIYDRLARQIEAHTTTLVFVNTRRLAERVTRHLATRLGEDAVTSHHGSLARERRLDAERRLKGGELKALVATASLEMGIDIGSIDLVCQIASPRSIATLLQRVGRSGHQVAGTPKGRIYPLTRDELVESAALLDAVRRRELDRLVWPRAPLDVLAQQMVAAVSVEDWREDDLWRLVRRAHPYRELTRERFEEVLAMLGDGFSTQRGRRSAYLHRDAVHGKLRARKGARLTALTSGGAIPDTADFDVVLEPEGVRLGSVDEDFAVESLPGDVFQLGNLSWRILRIEQGRVRVEDARGEAPNIPFWFGEMPGRTEELSLAVTRLRQGIAEALGDSPTAEDRHRVADELSAELHLPPAAAGQLVEYLAVSLACLGAMPTQRTLVMERFFDRAGDMHLVLHSPFGTRVNRAWGLALRKRFCRQFNFELQAAANDNAILLSLGPSHSFPLEEVFRYLHPASVRDVLVQALLDSPMFGVRWRWNASRALALPRFRGGRRVPPPLQRQAAEDLVAVVFPDQLACLETIEGDRQVPDHPLVAETLQDCLQDAMDLERLIAILEELLAGNLTTVARDLTEPSPLAHEILNAMPYAFLDDAPLEERRSHAVSARRWIDPESADDLGVLDAAAVERVRTEARPTADSAEELHDAMVIYGYLPADDWGDAAHLWQTELAAAGRATRLAGPAHLWVAAERLDQVQGAFRHRTLEPPIPFPERLERREWRAEEARVELLRSRLEALGPVTVDALAGESGWTPGEVEAALTALEGEGFVLRGCFTDGGEEEWCERRLLARIHRYTLRRLRSEIELVDRGTLGRYLLCWQQAAPGEDRGRGQASLTAALERLEGFAAPAAAWERDLLPARVADFDPAWLDTLFLSGRWMWCRLAPAAAGRRPMNLAQAPIALLRRENLPALRALVSPCKGQDLTANADAIRRSLEDLGASFFSDLLRHSGLLPVQAEEGLAELAAAGRVTSDAFAGLRALLVPASRRPAAYRTAMRAGNVSALEGGGRWSLLPQAPEAPTDDDFEAVADSLLKRYGVIFRSLLARETISPPWRDLLRVLRRREARGELRGGRFVAGFSGEQFALPKAIPALRSARKSELGPVSLSAADPLNLAGIITPGERLPAVATNRLLLQNGLPNAFHEAGRTRFLSAADDPAPPERVRQERILLRQPIPEHSDAALNAGRSRI
ncbi:MAG: DEAD/DEAH box helicase [Acidobacteriota bacterium]